MTAGGGARRSARWAGASLFWLCVVAGVAALVVLAWHTAVENGAGHACLVPGDAGVPPFPGGGRGADAVLGGAVLLGMAGALLGYRIGRRREQASLVLVSVATMALVAVVLGAATYVPRTGGQTVVLGPAAWVLGLFLGSVEAARLCGPSYPVGFEVARILAIAATGSSLIAAAASMWQVQWEQLRVRFAGDADVVVGLSDDTLPLVRALVAERRRSPRRPEWQQRGRRPRRGDLVRSLAARPSVVVVTEERDTALVAQARAAGARVLFGDAAQPDVLRRVATRHGLRRRVTLRRMYLLEPDQQRTLALHDSVERLLSSTDVRSGHRSDVVTRIVVRMEDPQEAREWRAAHLGDALQTSASGQQWFCDAVSPDEVLAHELCDRIAASGAERLLLVGDTPLTLAVLDELSWRRWCRYDLLLSAYDAAVQGGPALSVAELTALRLRWPVLPDPCVVPGDRPQALPELVAQRAEHPLTSVVLAGPAAEHIAEEWRRMRRPWVLDPPRTAGAAAPISELDDLVVTALRGTAVQLEERLLAELAGCRAPSAVVVTQRFDEYVAMGRRLARTAVLTALPDPGAVGVLPAGTQRGVERFGPTWLMAGQPLEDSWTKLARQQHAAYRHGLTTRPVVPRDPRKVTTSPWDLCPLDGAPQPEQLPEFFCEDNVRQLRHVLHATTLLGRCWMPVAAGEDAPGLTDDQRLWVARSEHERWRALREKNGWIHGDSRDDGARVHPDLRDWDTLTTVDAQGRTPQHHNVNQVEQILRRLHAVGLAAVPQEGHGTRPAPRGAPELAHQHGG